MNENPYYIQKILEGSIANVGILYITFQVNGFNSYKEVRQDGPTKSIVALNGKFGF